MTRTGSLVISIVAFGFFLALSLAGFVMFDAMRSLIALGGGG